MYVAFLCMSHTWMEPSAKEGRSKGLSKLSIQIDVHRNWAYMNGVCVSSWFRKGLCALWHFVTLRLDMSLNFWACRSLPGASIVQILEDTWGMELQRFHWSCSVFTWTPAFAFFKKTFAHYIHGIQESRHAFAWIGQAICCQVRKGLCEEWESWNLQT